MPSDVRTGTALGGFRIGLQIGEGAMGTVYLAEDTHLRRKVALKLLPAYFMISRDRGQFVRAREKYLELASKEFPVVHSEIRHDLLRIPWSILLLRCSK